MDDEDAALALAWAGLPSTEEPTMPTREAPTETADPWDTAPSLETWRRAAGTITDGDPDEHILRGLD